MEATSKLMRSGFVAMYGEIGQRLDEDTWLNWFGVYCAGWQDGRNGALPLEVNEYVLEVDENVHEPITLNRIPYPVGVRWGIYARGFVLSKTECLFFMEPSPSHRDDAHYKEFRWDTAQEAYAFWVENRQRIPATVAEQVEWWSKQKEGAS